MATRKAEELFALLKARRIGEVVAAFSADRAEIASDSQASYAVAAALAESGRLHDAISLLQPHALPEDARPPLLVLVGRLLHDVGESVQALPYLVRAARAQPENAAWWLILARAATQAKMPEQALRGAEVHALLRASNAEHALAYVMLLVRAQRHDEALIEFERLLRLDPNNLTAHSMYIEFVQMEFPNEALALQKRSWEGLRADGLSAPLVRSGLGLPTIYESEASAQEWRRNLHRRIQALTDLASDPSTSVEARWGCLDTTPFFLSNHDADITEIQCVWGDFLDRLYAPLKARFARQESGAGRLKTIGIVSNRLTDSSAGRFFNGWIAELARAGFQLNLYALGPKDATTDALGSTHSLKHFPKDEISQLRNVADAIATDRNDALLYPEPQGSPLTIAIAALRLAPMQCVAFGNPYTTGLSTIDYMLVPDVAEVANPNAHYREKVIRIAGVGAPLERAISNVRYSRRQLGFSDSERIFLVNQRLQKWTPHFIDTVLEVLKREVASKLVYFDLPTLTSTRAFQMNLRERFRKADLDFAAKTQVIAMVDRATFLAINAAADVSLDTFGFAGGATSVDALSVGLPVVTLDGKWLRGRQTAGILRAMGVDELIASDQREYAEKAISVASDAKWKHKDANAADGWQRFAKSWQSVKPPFQHASRVYSSVVEFFASL